MQCLRGKQVGFNVPLFALHLGEAGSCLSPLQDSSLCGSRAVEWPSLALTARVFLQRKFHSRGRNTGFGTAVQTQGDGCTQHVKPLALCPEKEFWLLLLTEQSIQSIQKSHVSENSKIYTQETLSRKILMFLSITYNFNFI